MKNEIPVSAGKIITNRIIYASESGGTKTDGSSLSVFCVIVEEGWRGKERSMAKFLSYEYRLEIESCLKAHMTFTEIGK